MSPLGTPQVVWQRLADIALFDGRGTWGDALVNLDPPMRSLGVTVSASLGSFVALCLGWVCWIRRCARLFHCGFLVVPVLGGWSARGEGGWAERCGVERVELVLPGPAGG